MRLSANKALKTKAEAKKLNMFSKQWTPGDTLRAVYPIYWDEEFGSWQLLVGAVWGYRVGNAKELNLGTIFIPALTDFSEDGSPIGTPDIAYRFSRIAKTFVVGQHRAEIESINKKNWMGNDAAKFEALRSVEDKYKGEGLNAIRPIISNPVYQITTECVVIQMKDNKPVVDTARLVSQPLSEKNINRLNTIIADQKYVPEHVDQETDFLEVEWSFPKDTADRKNISAQSASCVGIVAEERLAATHADDWKKVQGTISLIAFDSDTIAHRATRKVDESRIEQAITAYSFMHSEYLDALDMQQDSDSVEQLCRNADIIHSLSLNKAISNKELLDRLEQATKETSVPVTQSIPDPVPNAPTLQGLLNTNAVETSQVSKSIEELALNDVPVITEPVQADPTPIPVAAPAPAVAPMPTVAPAPAPAAPVKLNPQSIISSNPSAIASMTDSEISDIDLQV